MGNFSLYLLAGLYILAGTMHFIYPKVYISITPKWVPSPAVINVLVGITEITLGILVLVPETQVLAAWGIIALLIAVFPANWYHHQKARRRGKMVAATLIRLPLQLALIWWAWLYT
ncbi:MAG TPA: DoxX family protein [Cytophagales bacterium]|nr:DoxX family protein [Cytophagales bacterium]HAA23360.1 DoxX family protein [Cytophagales bacterium]HAP65031.1 DoxX family protein [Cytophagales bacterium]